jgi:alpha-2-macroglobulin
VRGERFSAVFSDWQNGISVYDFGINFPFFGGDTPIRAHLYTERPLYRAGQSAYLRGVVRTNDDFSYALPKDARISVVIQDPTGNATAPREIALDAFGAFSFDHPIPAGAPLGPYTALLTATDAQGVPIGQTQASFTVAAYRPPEFEVTVTPSLSETVRGAPISATANTRYLSGGPLANARINWNVLASPTTFAAQGFDRYTFSDSDNPWRCFSCWWQRDETPPQPIARGDGRSGADGALAFSVPLTSELRDARGEPISGPVQLSIEAAATGSDDQVLAGRDRVIVHPASFYAGVTIDGYVIDAKKPVSAELVAVDWAGKPQPGKTLEVSVVRREWESKFVPLEGGGGRWESEPKDEPIANGPVTTDARGEARYGFTPPKAGTYKITVASTDEAGRVVRASRFVWATGNDYVAWFRPNNDRINLIIDKTTFEQGETAEILIPTPFIDAQTTSHYMLVTVERGHIKKHEVVRVASSTLTYRVPILDDYAPNIYVSAVLLSGPNAPRPDYKLGLLTLKVNPRKQTFVATLTPSGAKAEPGTTVTYTLSVKDSAGRPVQGSFSLDLVDKGVLNLSPRPAAAIVDAFYGPAGLGVSTATGLTVSANRVAEEELRRQTAAFGAGGNAQLAPLDSAVTESAAAPKAEAPAPAQRARTLADDASQQPAAAVRENFADTAFWKGDVTTDANGNATVAVKLPDNLTTWVMRAVGVDVETRVGEATVDVQVSKPLLIRPVTPRFLVVGDQIELSAIVNNNTEQAQKATVSLAAEGVTVTTPIDSVVEIPANGEVVVRWRGVATDRAQADLVFTVKNDQYQDSSKPRLSTAPNGGLKINRWSAPEVVGTAGELSGAITRTEVIAIPPGLDKTQGALNVRVDASLAASMLDGLTYLEGFPYECAEQTVSRFLPNVLTFKALKDLGVRNAELEAKLPALVETNIARLVELQNPDGGWGWWKSETSNANVSAYAVFGMLKAKQAGFAVNDASLERGVVFLESQLVALTALSRREAQDWQTWLQYVLTEAGRDVSADVARSFEARGNMSHYAKAYLILSMGARDAKDARIKTLLADLNAKIIQSATGAHWEERETDWWAMGSDTRTTAIVLTAIAKYDSQNKLAPNIVRWLMVARKAGTGFWASTHESAWALIALTEWMTLTGELKADYAYDVMLNQNVLAKARASQATLTQTVAFELPIAELLTDVGNRLVFGKGDGPGRLYYSAHVKAYLPVPQIKAADRGMVVQRRYVRADCNDGVKCPTVTEAKIGDVLRVELTLVLPSSIHYLQMEDPLPAGAEAIDTNLATASQLDEGPGLVRSEPALEGDGIQPRRWSWWWNWWSRSEMRDDRVALFASYLAPGTYTYSYTMRMTSAGTFNVIPAFANAQYFPEVFGRSEGSALTVNR